VNIDGPSDWILDLLTTYTHDSQIQVITSPPLISTIHKSPQHPLGLFQPAVSLPAVPWKRLLTMEILQLHALKSLFTDSHTELSCNLVPCLQHLGTDHTENNSSSVVSGFVAAEMCLPRRCEASPRRGRQKTPFLSCRTVVAFVCVAAGTYLPSRCPEKALVHPLFSRSLHSSGSTRYNI
jgi:hypothetical protein